MKTTKEHITIDDLRRKGIPIISGDKYIPKEWIPKKVPTIEEIRKRLSKIKGNLSDTISEIRDEE